MNPVAVSRQVSTPNPFSVSAQPHRLTPSFLSFSAHDRILFSGAGPAKPAVFDIWPANIQAAYNTLQGVMDAHAADLLAVKKPNVRVDYVLALAQKLHGQGFVNYEALLPELNGLGPLEKALLSVHSLPEKDRERLVDDLIDKTEDQARHVPLGAFLAPTVFPLVAAHSALRAIQDIKNVELQRTLVPLIALPTIGHITLTSVASQSLVNYIDAEVAASPGVDGSNAIEVFEPFLSLVENTIVPYIAQVKSIEAMSDITDALLKHPFAFTYAPALYQSIRTNPHQSEKAKKAVLDFWMPNIQDWPLRKTFKELNKIEPALVGEVYQALLTQCHSGTERQAVWKEVSAFCIVNRQSCPYPQPTE